MEHPILNAIGVLVLIYIGCLSQNISLKGGNKLDRVFASIPVITTILAAAFAGFMLIKM